MRTAVLCLATAAAATAAAAVEPREVIDEDVDRVIGETVRYLWAQQQREGCWDHYLHYGRGMFLGGTTALSLFALLEAGESPQDPRMQKGLEYLVNLKTDNTYVIATRLMALSQVMAASKDGPYGEAIRKDIDWLTARSVPAGGAWGYSGPERYGDNSCSQFALLALWEAQRAGIDVNASAVRSAEAAWLRRQQADGGWTYAGQPTAGTPSTTSMTAAGVASLYICRDLLSLASGPYRHQARLDAAWAHLAGKLEKTYFKDGYLAFCVQRIGMASGQKFIGEMDWFATAAAELARPDPLGRTHQGQWGPVVRACFELIFMARGRTPLTFNKLKYGDESQWNYHSRDVPRFTEYMRRNFELRMRWQVVKITDDVQLMLDAPILMVAGAEEVKFTAEEWARLREYTLRGGMLLFVPTGNSRPFAESVRAALADLYAEQRRLAGAHYALEPLSADHPLYSAHSPIVNPATAAPAEGVSDGTRLLAVICHRDHAAAWQRRQLLPGKLDYQMGVNVYFYATGGNPMRMRMRPVFVGTGAEARHKVRIAWLRHGGNWYTQPWALEYLGRKLQAENRVGIETDVGAPVEAEALRGHHLAWMTGSSEFSLSPAELRALEGYLRGGGTLFVNAVGGSREFNASARAMFEQLFPERPAAVDDGVISGYVARDSPMMTGDCGEFRGAPLTGLARTHAWRLISRTVDNPPLRVYVRAGRALVIHAPYGVHDTLDGHTAHGALSYMPPSARDIAANVVLYGLMEKPKPPQPTTGPTTTATPTTTPTAAGDP